VKLWELSASDRGEHTKLIGLDNNPEDILEYLNTSENVIPQATASLLTYCCYEDASIIPRAKGLFGNQYRFDR
jgi:hypothetical protein